MTSSQRDAVLYQEKNRRSEGGCCLIVSENLGFSTFLQEHPIISISATMATEPGDPQESIPEAAAFPAPKQVKGKDKVQPDDLLEASVFTSCPQNRDGDTPVPEDSHLSSGVRITRSPARNPLSFRMMQAKVTLLDGSLFTCTVEVRHAPSGETDGTQTGHRPTPVMRL